MERESDKPLAVEGPRNYKTSFDKIQHLQQQLDSNRKVILRLRKELEVCHEKIMKLSPK